MPADRASEPAGRALEPAGKALDHFLCPYRAAVQKEGKEMRYLRKLGRKKVRRKTTRWREETKRKT